MVETVCTTSIVARQFRRERGIRHVDGGERQVEQQRDDEVIPKASGRIKGRDKEQKDKDDAEGNCAKEEPRPAAAARRSRRAMDRGRGRPRSASVGAASGTVA